MGVLKDHFAFGKLVIDQIIISERPQKYFLTAKDRPNSEVSHVNDMMFALLGHINQEAVEIKPEGIKCAKSKYRF